MNSVSMILQTSVCKSDILPLLLYGTNFTTFRAFFLRAVWLFIDLLIASFRKNIAIEADSVVVLFGHGREGEDD